MINVGTYRTSIDLIFDRGGLLAAVAGLLLVTMQFQTTPLGLQAQNIPLTSVLALLCLPLALLRIPRSPLMTLVTVFACYVILQSLAWLVVDLLGGDADMRIISWARQSGAFVAGMATFTVLRSAMMFLDDRQIVRYVMWGTVPLFILSMVNIAWGALGMEWAGEVVQAAREILVPRGYTSAMRATGLATEPSTLAGSIVVIVLPFLLFLGSQREYRWAFIGLLVVTTMTFGWTFSFSGLILLVMVLMMGVVLGPDRRMMVVVIAVFLVLGLLALVLFPSNQVLRHTAALALGRENISFIDRFYSTFGPFLQSFSSLTTVGYGLGGTVSHFREMVPADVQADILAVKWKELPNLGTLVGRIFGETGLIGFSLFSSIIGLALFQIKKTLGVVENPRFLLIARFGLLASLLSSAMIFGSFHTPFLWFWLALADSRYMMEARNRIHAIVNP